MELQPVLDFDIDALLDAPSAADNNELELQRLKKNVCLLKSKIHNYNAEETKGISTKRLLNASSQIEFNTNDDNDLNDLYKKFDNIIEQKNELLQRISNYERINSGNNPKPGKNDFGDKRSMSLNDINGKDMQPEVCNAKKTDSVGEAEDSNKTKYSLNFALAKKGPKETVQQTNKIIDVFRTKIENITKGVSSTKYYINVDIELQDKSPITARKQIYEHRTIADNLEGDKETKQLPKQNRDNCTNTESLNIRKNTTAEENVVTKKNEILIKFIKSLMSIKDHMISVQCQNVLKRINGLDKLEKFDNEYEQQSLFSPCSTTDVDTLTSEDERDSVDSGLMSPYNNSLVGIGFSPLPSSNNDCGGFIEPTDKIDNRKHCKTNSNHIIESDSNNTEPDLTTKCPTIKRSNADTSRIGNLRPKRKKVSSNNVLIPRSNLKTVDIGLDPVKELIYKHEVKTVDVALDPVNECKVKTVDIGLDPVKEIMERQVTTVNVGLSPINEIRIKTTDVSLSPIKELTKVSTKTIGLNPIKKLRITTTDVSLSPIKELPKITTCTIGLNPIKELQKETVRKTYTCRKCSMDYNSSAIMSLMEMEMEDIHDKNVADDQPSSEDRPASRENSSNIQHMLSEMNLYRALSPLNTSEQLVEHSAVRKESYVREVLSDIVLELMTEHFRSSNFSTNMPNRDVCQRLESASTPSDKHIAVIDKTHVKRLPTENIQKVTSEPNKMVLSSVISELTTKSTNDDTLGNTETESEHYGVTCRPNIVSPSSKVYKIKKPLSLHQWRNSKIVKHKIRPIVPAQNCLKIVKEKLHPMETTTNLNSKSAYEKAAKVAADLREMTKQKGLTPRKSRSSLDAFKASLRHEAVTSSLAKNTNNDHIATDCINSVHDQRNVKTMPANEKHKELIRSLFGTEDDGEISPSSLIPNESNLNDKNTTNNLNTDKTDNMIGSLSFKGGSFIPNETISAGDDSMQVCLKIPNKLISTLSGTSTPTTLNQKACKKLFQNGDDTSPSRYSLRNKSKRNELFGEEDDSYDSSTSIVQPVIMSTGIISDNHDSFENIHIAATPINECKHLHDKIEQGFSKRDADNNVPYTVQNNRKRSLSMSNEIESKRMLKVVLDRAVVSKALATSINSANNNALSSNMESSNNIIDNKSTNLKEQTSPALISYEDLSVFSPGSTQATQPKSNIKRNTISSYKSNIFCKMLEKYGRHSIQKVFKPDRHFETSVEAVCNELECDIHHILSLQMTHQTKAKMIVLADKLMNVDKKVFLSSLLRYLQSDKRKRDVICKRYTPPAPAMTKPEQVLLFVLDTMRKRDSNIINDLLVNIEHALFRLNNTPDFEQVDLLSHFYAVLCRFIGNKRRLRIFMLDAMYCLSFKATNLVQQCLDVWMNVLPLAHMNAANTPLVTTFVYVLHFFKCDDYCDRVLGLRRNLQKTYAYDMNKWNQKTFLDYLQNCFVELKDNTFEEKTLKMCLLILAKRHGTQWCEKNIVNGILLPFIEDVSTPDHVRAFCVSVLGALMRPYPVDMKLYVDMAINKLSIMLSEKCSQRLEEAVITSLVQISKQYPARVMRIIMAWQPQFDLSKELEECLCEFIRHRPISAWIKLFGSR